MLNIWHRLADWLEKGFEENEVTTLRPAECPFCLQSPSEGGCTSSAEADLCGLNPHSGIYDLIN